MTTFAAAGSKARLGGYILRARPLMILSAPIIYAVLIPFVLLDLFVSLYRFTCFPVFGIPAVRRGDYIVFDRGNLAYLNLIEKINCFYCSYANGLIGDLLRPGAYVRQQACKPKRAEASRAKRAERLAKGGF